LQGEIELERLGSEKFTQAEENAKEKTTQYGFRKTKLLQDWEKSDQPFAEKDSTRSDSQGLNQGEGHATAHRRRRSKELQILNPLWMKMPKTDRIEKIANTC
jgi:hypothetical protein